MFQLASACALPVLGYLHHKSFAGKVMTGVFCNSAIKAAERDHEMVIHSLLKSRKEFKELVANLFQKIDDLGLGMITISEFERHFNDEAVRAFFESLEMGAVDAWTLFASLDADGDNVISLRDFTERCIQLHGPARSVDLYALTQQNAACFVSENVPKIGAGLGILTSSGC